MAINTTSFDTDVVDEFACEKISNNIFRDNEDDLYDDYQPIEGLDYCYDSSSGMNDYY